MALSAPRTEIRTARATSVVPLAADLVSWGFALAIVLVVLSSERYYSVFEGVLFVTMFVLLRQLARQVRRDAARQTRRI